MVNSIRKVILKQLIMSLNILLSDPMLLNLCLKGSLVTDLPISTTQFNILPKNKKSGTCTSRGIWILIGAESLQTSYSSYLIV